MSGFTNNIVIKADEHLKKMMGSPLILFTDTLQGAGAVSVHALFTKLDDAVAYLIRYATNFYAEVYNDNPKDYNEKDFETFNDYVFKEIQENYHLSIVTHLDPKLPVYQLQSGNYLCCREPVDYLTNSVEVWEKANPGIDAERWRNHCFVKVDPPLPDLYVVDE